MNKILFVIALMLLCSCTRTIHEVEYKQQLVQPIAANSIDADMAKNYCHDNCVSFDISGIKSIVYDSEYDYNYIEYTDSLVSNIDCRRYEFFPFAIVYIENELVPILKDIACDNIDCNTKNKIIANITDFKCSNEFDLYYLKFNKEAKDYIRNHGTLTGFKSL